MKRNTVKYIIDIGLIITFFGVFITGLIRFPGLMQSLGITRTYLPNYQITIIHEWSGLIMGLLVLLHITLNWRWVFAMTKKFFSGSKK